MMFIAMMLLSLTVHAQVRISEPEFVNSYVILTSDTTCEVVAKELAVIGRKKSWLNSLGKVADVAGSAGMLGSLVGLQVGSVSGALGGLRAASTASAIGSAASTVGLLTGSKDVDMVFDGATSPCSVSCDGDLRIVVKFENNEQDPTELYRIVKMKGKKKERRVKWLSFNSMKIAKKVEKSGVLSFVGHKYGDSSYILVVDKDKLSKGEYGIFFLNVAAAAEVPVGTFAIK